jgi:hypothetical protein
MSAGNKSISQRLAHTRKPDVRLEIALDWAENWRQDQMQAIKKLTGAHESNCVQLVESELLAITEKRFNALPKVIRILLEREVETETSAPESGKR